MRRTVLLLAAMMLSLVAASGVAYAATVSNGGFEAGDLGGWTAKKQEGSSGRWFAYSGATSPTGAPIEAPPVGEFAATTDQDGPGSRVLYKNVKLAAGKKHTLSFYVYYQNSPGILRHPQHAKLQRPRRQPAVPRGRHEAVRRCLLGQARRRAGEGLPDRGGRPRHAGADAPDVQPHAFCGQDRAAALRAGRQHGQLLGLGRRGEGEQPEQVAAGSTPERAGSSFWSLALILAPIHRSARKVNSANFGLRRF